MRSTRVPHPNSRRLCPACLRPMTIGIPRIPKTARTSPEAAFTSAVTRATPTKNSTSARRRKTTVTIKALRTAHRTHKLPPASPFDQRRSRNPQCAKDEERQGPGHSSSMEYVVQQQFEELNGQEQ